MGGEELMGDLGPEVDPLPEAEVESVEEEYIPHIEPPQQPLSYAEYVWYSLLNYFSNPWAFLILLYLFYRLVRLIQPLIVDPMMERYNAWQEKREQLAEAAAFKKDPDAYQAKMEAMEAARMRLQARYDQDAESESRRRAELEERRREQDIKDWEDHQSGKGYKNRAQPKVDKDREALEQQARIKGKKGFPAARPEYNPLMGGGGGGGFRPAPRSSGGG